MAKKDKSPQAAARPKVVYVTGPLWTQSLAVSVKRNPDIVNKIKEFQQFKEQDPLAPFGGSDKMFAADGVFKNYLPKARKAHLTFDTSIVYELSGRDPTVIKLYGVFSHDDLGTGQPANRKIQQAMAKKLASEDID